MTTYEKQELEIRRTIDRLILEMADRDDVESQNFKISAEAYLRKVEEALAIIKPVVEPEIIKLAPDTNSFPFDPIKPFTNIC